MNFRVVCLLALAALTLQRAVAGLGVVDTLDGQRHEGFIRLQPDHIDVVAVAGEAVRSVAMTNLQSLWLRDSSSAESEPVSAASDFGSMGWTPSNIGNGARGGVSYGAGHVMRLAATGTNIWGNRDSFHFSHVSMGGDGEISARLLRFDPASNRSRTGLMMREGLEVGARHVFLGRTPRGLVVQWREEVGGGTRVEPLDATGLWLRLKRVGNDISAYSSREGRQWQLVRRVALPMKHVLLVGPGVSGQGVPDSARFAPRSTQALFDHIQQGAHVRYHSYVPRVALKSGSMTSGEISFADHRQLRFIGAPSWQTVPVREVARIDFYWVPPRYQHWLRGEQSGVLLSSGEFVEGNFRGLNDGKCLISSVLFGLKQFEIDGEVLSVVLGKPALPLGAFAVKTWSGSTWHGRLVSMDQTGLVLREESMGRVTIPFYELKELSRRGAG